MSGGAGSLQITGNGTGIFFSSGTNAIVASGIASFGLNVQPHDNNTYNLGLNDKRWSNIWGINIYGDFIYCHVPIAGQTISGAFDKYDDVALIKSGEMPEEIQDKTGTLNLVNALALTMGAIKQLTARIEILEAK